MSHSADTPRQTASAPELRAALGDVLNRHFGTQRCIVNLERYPSDYRSSFTVDELTVCLDDGTTLQLLFKDLSWQALIEEARRAKPAFLYNPLREIETYQSILAPRRLGTAVCYGAVVDHQLGRYWLFLENVPGLQIRFAELPVWEEAARWLAVMHSNFAKETGRLTQVAPLLSYDGDFYRQWMRRAQEFSGQAEPSGSRATRQQIEWLAGRYDRVIERLLALPATFIHGEFSASNILVQETGESLRVCPVDWEMAAVGPGLIDLAALTAGRWTEQEKAAIVLAYQGDLVPAGGWPHAPNEFLAALDCCHLHLAVQWLGWAVDWTPPPEQTQNWLSEALRLAEKLGL